MELDNAINQAIREIDTRFDFKNTGAKIEMVGEKINIEADTDLFADHLDLCTSIFEVEA